ncbi:uncharacterized mitochondrial protein-like protein [Tanacetum coccineum]
MADNTQAKAMGEVRNMRIQIGCQAYLANFLVLDIAVDRELPLLLGRLFLRTFGALIDMGRGTMVIYDGVTKHTYYTKPKAKDYLENFDTDEDEDCLSCFNVVRDEDGNLKSRSYLFTFHNQLKMTTLAEYMTVVGTENRPPMLDKSMYNSGQSHMLLYIKGKKNGRMMLESIKNGPLVYPTIEENGQIRIPIDVYFLIKHYQAAKDIWDIVKLLIQGTELSYQEHECKLYNEFDKFTLVTGESFYEYYLRFAQLINDMHIIGMSMQQVEVNTKFLNALQPEWSKFVTDVKLAKNMYNTNYDQLYAYLSQHEGHANEGCDDPIACLNKAMAFMVTVQHVQGRHGQSFAGTGTKGNDTSSRGNNDAGQSKVVKCYNCQGEGNMARQCTQLKRPRNSAWFKEKMLLVQTQESSQVLDEEQLTFLADPRILDGQATQTTILQNAAFQTDDLDAYDSDCDDISTSKAVLMANLSSYDSDVLFEVPQHDTYQYEDMINQNVQEKQYFKQSLIDYVPNNEIISDSNIISYEQDLQETQNAIVQDTNSSTQQDAMIMSVFE